MGLRDFLQKMQGATELTQGFQDSTSKLAQQQARSRLAEAFPTLGPQAMAGDQSALGQLSQLATEAGSNEPLSGIFDIQKLRMAAEAKKASQPGVDSMKQAAGTLLTLPGVDPKLNDALKTATTDDEIKFIADAAKKQTDLFSQKEQETRRREVFGFTKDKFQTDKILALQDSVLKNADFKKKQDQFNAGVQIQNVLSGAEGIDANTVPTLTAKLIEGGNRLSDADRAAYSNVGGVENFITTSVQKAQSGQLSPESKRLFTKLTDVIMKRVKEEAGALVDNGAERSQSIGLDPKAFRAGINLDKLFLPKGAAPKQPEVADSIVKEFNTKTSQQIVDEFKTLDPKLWNDIQAGIKATGVAPNKQKLLLKLQELRANKKGE